ncbi:ROK family protein [bacterium]|nr:ROK family protein [bacterium]
MPKNNRVAVGIDLGGTSIKAGLVSETNGLIKEVSVETRAEEGPERVLDRIADLISSFRADNAAIVGVGIGAPGAINWDRTTVSGPPNFPGWSSIHMGNSLTERVGQPLLTLVENDANVAALGSAHYGVGHRFDSFIMVTLGTGVGGAIIYDNKIFRGSTGAAGEIGHMTIDYEGPFARSGVAGAIEAYLGQRFLSRHARYRLMNKKDSIMHQMADEDLQGITPKMLFDAAEFGDEGAKDVLAWAGHKLGCVLGSAVNLLDIRKIVVGGGLSAAGDYILNSTRTTLNHYVTPILQSGIEVVQETRGNDVGMLGAGHLVFQHLDEQGYPTD